MLFGAGLLFLLNPAPAVSQGNLLKSPTSSSVYYVTEGKRYAFPNEKTYKSWYADFSSVATVSEADLASYPLAGNVTYRPGVRMIKIQSDPKTYAVSGGGLLRHVSTENVARSLFGNAWNTMIDDIPVSFFTHYEIGEPITETLNFNTQAELTAAANIHADLSARLARKNSGGTVLASSGGGGGGGASSGGGGGSTSTPDPEPTPEPDPTPELISDPTPNPTPEPCPTGQVRVGSSCIASVSLASTLSTNWHPDPDDDGIVTASDNCPNVYNPAQDAGACDGSRLPVSGGPITDLHAEHVTPYGAWIDFTSPHWGNWGWDAALVWSTNRADVETEEGIQNLISSEQWRNIDVQAGIGQPILQPIIFHDLEPSTTYHFTARRREWNGVLGPAGNIISVTTKAEPYTGPATSHPRAVSSPAHVAAVASRISSGDPRTTARVSELAGRALSNSTSITQYDRDYCVISGMLFKATGDTAHRDAAMRYIDEATEYYESITLYGNRYRWIQAVLGRCLDLMWDDLDTETRNRAVAAYLQDDESVIGEGLRIIDTDETTNEARTRLINGLVACGAPANELDPSLSARACAVLEDAKRIMFGIELPKTKRDIGFFAASGGSLPDGNWYSQGSSHYWMDALLALLHAGVPVQEYAPWVKHNMYLHSIYNVTPSRIGYDSFGDIDNDFNTDTEPLSTNINVTHASLIAKQMGFLDLAGDTASANLALNRIDTNFTPYARQMMWPRLFYEHSGLNPSFNLPEAHLSSGSGMLYDRTSWHTDASFFTQRSGWSGVDHSHSDQGNFKLYRDGQWIVHEALGYNGDGNYDTAHNTIVLPDGQYGLAGAGSWMSRMLTADSGDLHTLTDADITGAYNSYYNDVDKYDDVRRQVLWLKGVNGENDRIVVHDFVKSKGGAAIGTTGWRLHLREQATVNGSTATVYNGNHATTFDALRSDMTLQTLAPVGASGEYPGTLHTHRVQATVPITSDRYESVWTLESGQATHQSRESIAMPGHTGARIGTDTVLFPNLSANASPAPASQASLSGLAAGRIWLTNMKPNTGYSVTATESGGAFSVQVQQGSGIMSTSGGLLVFDLVSDGAISGIY